MKQRFWQHGGITEISMDEVNDAIDRVLAGPEKKDG